MAKTLSRLTFDGVSRLSPPRAMGDPLPRRAAIAIWILASIAGWTVVVAAVSLIV